MMRDRYIHAEKTILPGFGHKRLQALLADALGAAPDLPRTVGTGCGLRRPLGSTSTVPEEITCLPCREWLRGECLFWANAAASAAAIPAQAPWTATPAAAELRAEERTYRALAARFEVTR